MRQLIVIVILLGTTLVSAQDTNQIRNRAFGWVPQYSIMGGLRFDLDFKVDKEKPEWLIFSPTIYLVADESNIWDFKNLWGVGLEVQNRYYLSSTPHLPRGFYMGYGPLFHYYSIEEERLYPETIVEDGIEYTIIKNGLVTTGVYKAGLTLSAGYQALVSNSFYIDFYTGAGIRLSFDDIEPGGLSKFYNDGWINYGYSGTLMTFGIRMGLAY